MKLRKKNRPPAKRALKARKIVRAKPVPRSSRQKVAAYRKRQRAKGLRLVQMWLPDSRRPEFASEARRQCLLANKSAFAAEDQAWVDSMSAWNRS
jgi:hypothetical protein